MGHVARRVHPGGHEHDVHEGVGMSRCALCAACLPACMHACMHDHACAFQMRTRTPHHGVHLSTACIQATFPAALACGALDCRIWFIPARQLI
jgi:hypothetical protein